MSIFENYILSFRAYFTYVWKIISIAVIKDNLNHNEGVEFNKCLIIISSFPILCDFLKQNMF